MPNSLLRLVIGGAQQYRIPLDIGLDKARELVRRADDGLKAERGQAFDNRGLLHRL